MAKLWDLSKRRINRSSIKVIISLDFSASNVKTL